MACLESKSFGGGSESVRRPLCGSMLRKMPSRRGSTSAKEAPVITIDTRSGRLRPCGSGDPLAGFSACQICFWAKCEFNS